MSLRFVNILSIVSIVALLVVLLGLREAQQQDWARAIAEVRGEGMYTFTLAGQSGVADALDWRARDLQELSALAGVDSVSWRGGRQITQVPGSQMVIPYSFVSPGYPADLNLGVVAGRTFGQDDEGRSRALVSSALAARLFRDLTLDEVVGQYLDLGGHSGLIVGVYAGEDDVLVAMAAPLERFGSTDVSTVIVRSRTPEKEELAVLKGWLEGKENLTALGVIPYRELIRPDVVRRNSPYQQEIALLFEFLAVCALALAAINIANQALLLGAERQTQLALARTSGATRGRLLWLEAGPYLRAEGVAVVLGLAVGAVLVRFLEGVVTFPVLLEAAAAVVAAVVVGSLPATSQVFRLFPWRVLRDGPRASQRTWLRLLGAVGLVASIALVVTAGGFANAGKKVIETEIAGIGADLYMFQADRDTLLPAQPLTPEDLTVLEAAYPGYPFLLLTWDLVTIEGNEVQLQVVEGSYFEVSGTSLSWEAEPGSSGIYLGAQLARSLFGDEAVPAGATLTLEYRGQVLSSTKVLGVAREPDVANLASLQLSADGAVVVGEVLPSRTVLSRRLYARLPDDQEAVLAVQAALNRRVGEGSSPFVATKPARGYEAEMRRLEAQGQRFAVAAVFVLLLAGAGVATMLYADAYTRRRETALGRVFGRTRANTLNHSVLRSAALVLMLALVGSFIGTAAYLVLAEQRGYAPLVPASWIVGTSAGATALGVVIARTTAAWLVGLAPLQVLRGHA